MKNIITLFLVCFLILSCGTYRNVKESNTVSKTTKSSTETAKDSVVSITEVLPTSNELILNVNDFKFRGDFEQKVLSGEGNETIIQKKGDKIILKNKNSGSKNKTTNTKSKEKTELYTSEYVLKELSKTIKRTSWKYKILFFILIALWQRKLITQLLVSVIPSMTGKKIIKLFLGKTIEK